MGEAEKLVNALFEIARVHKPSIIFIDEIDGLLEKRGESQKSTSRTFINQFLSSMDGLDKPEEDQILVLGTTNRPQDLDEAVIRRFVSTQSHTYHFSQNECLFLYQTKKQE